ncbi:MAG: translation initiation factor IF-2 [Oscillibacter sp.]|nr:translation initiation factor IF-2 [Oscillibacter sp.]
MANSEKYRVHEVAKDFGLPTKTITEILTKYVAAPKNHMQVLSDHELSVIFDYLTQHNQVSNIQVIFADTYQEKKEEPAAPAQKAQSAPQKEEKKPAEQAARQSAPQPASPAAQPRPQGNGQQSQQAQQPQQSKPQGAAQQPQSRVPQKKIVDTRKGGDVNLAKYDERLEDLGGQRGQRMQQKAGKQKIRSSSQQRRGGMTFSNKRRQDEAERMRRLQLEIAKKAPLKVQIPDEISVGELASRMKKTGAEVVKCLMKNGIMASLSQIIDFDTASFVAEEMGCKVEKEVVVTIEEKLIDVHEDTPDELEPRAPVVVVMGHVDHGKTTLLDTIRNTSVAAGEAGGITQHIGAYQVEINGKPITFLDTPGHEAFTSMRARGAMITDIAILMVAADDGIMPQTVESINHAKAAGIPIIVAVNKIDKENANPDRVLQQLTEYGLVPEDWGGETICCKVSAKKNIGIENLLEMVTLTAEMAELKANPNRAGQGTVIEARLDKGRGPVATLLVQNGTLKQGDIIIAGTAVGRVRTMLDYKGNRLTQAGPSVPVEVAGLSEAPTAGSPFFAVADERMARELVEQRKAEEKAKAAAPVQKVSLENLFDQIQAGERKELALIVKADVQGSVEAVKASLEKLSNDEVNVRVIHGGVGAVNESDVMLAASSGAIIVGFNVRPDAAARDGAARQNVDMRMYRVIYDCIDEIEAAMKGMLAPKFREVVLGHAEVRQTYKVSGVGTVAGCYVQDGKIVRACSVRVVRDGIVIHEGSLASLKRFKDDAREVAENYECGMTVEKFNDIKEGDIIEAFTMEEIPQ